MNKIILPARAIEPLDLMDEALAALRLIHSTLFDSDLVNMEMGEEVTSVLWDAIQKLSPIREALNEELGRS